MQEDEKKVINFKFIHRNGSTINMCECVLNWSSFSLWLSRAMIISLVKNKLRQIVRSHVQLVLESDIWLAEHVGKQRAEGRVTMLHGVQKINSLQCISYFKVFL